MLVTNFCILKNRGRVLKDIGKESKLGSKLCSCVGMERGERKNFFIEDNIPGYVNSPFFWV